MKLKDYLKKAQKEKWAIGQFNFSTLEQLRGILEAARQMKSPVILGTSESESKYFGFEEILALAEISKLKYHLFAFLNLDHGKDLNWLKKAIDFGYSAVHFDGSDLSLDENIKNTKKVAEYAHKKGVLVEGELGYIKGGSRFKKGGIEIKKEELTLPDEVKKFVKETRIDSLAISIGNVHGIYEMMPKLDFERLEKIKKITSVFLVLHGGSGIPNTEIKSAIDFGISKINFNTELRIIWKESLFNFFKKYPEEIKPYKILPEIQMAIQKKVEEKITLLNSKNKL